MQCYLAKIVQETCYGEAMIAGRLFLNRLSYFKKAEQGARHDADEGRLVWHRNIIKEIKINDIPFNTVKRLATDLPGVDDTHVLCLFAGHTERFPSERLIEELGAYAVLIRDPGKFFLRVGEACDRYGYKGRGCYVRYYNNDCESVEPGKDTVFYKPDGFRYQHEYRIAVETGTQGFDPLILDIGEIGDIAEVVGADDIERSFLGRAG